MPAADLDRCKRASLPWESCGLGLSNVPHCRVCLLRVERDEAATNAVYASCFPPAQRSARTWTGASGPARGALIGIDIVAQQAAAEWMGQP